MEEGNGKVWYLLISGLLIVLIGRIIVRKMYPKQEGFSGMERFTQRTNGDLFGKFYVRHYDRLMYSREKNLFEYRKIREATGLSGDSRVLDMGSGTGHHLQLLSENGVPGIAIDSSEDMVSYARATYPDLDFRQESMETAEFPAGAFSHVLCLYFTIYYVRDKKRVFENCMRWLSPGGFLVIHLVDKHRFSPVVPGSNRVRNVNVQKYENNRITKSVARLDKYNYVSSFTADDPDQPSVSLFTEKFTDNSGKVLQNDHSLYMETQSSILFQAKEAGFVLDARIDMGKIGYHYQYLYVLQKPE